MLDFATIYGDKANWFERPFEETKIFEVIKDFIKDFNGDKLPGLDGFPMSFFQSC